MNRPTDIGAARCAAPALTRRAAAAALVALPALARGAVDEEGHGRDRGYPTRARAWDEKPYRVGNYSGLAAIKPTAAVPRSGEPRALADARPSGQISPAAIAGLTDHMARWPVTGLIALQGDQVLFEDYAYDRTATMPMHGWSMSKTVLALMVGIAIRDGLIQSVHDTAARYVPELAGTLHGETRLRHLLQMSSGARIVHKTAREGGDHGRVYGDNLLRPDADSLALVKGWNERAEPAAQRFNYNELAPLTITQVLSRVVASRQQPGMSLPQHVAGRLWGRLGAQADASWMVDSRGVPIGCIGFSATLRDWARLGLLMADGGSWRGTEVVPAQWLVEMSTIAAADVHLKAGTVSRGAGYGYFTWVEAYPQRRVFSLRGHHGQFVIVAPALRLVLAQTAVDDTTGMNLYRNFTGLMAELERKPVPAAS